MKRTNGPCRTRPTADAGPLLWDIQALRPDNQSRKDGGAPPTCTILPPPPTIDDKPLANVEHFKYLGGTISCDGSLDREIDNRISKASQALGSLHNQMLSEHNIRLSTKLKVYNAVIFPSLLYGCETWTLYHRHIKKLELFHMQALRSILGIRWQDHITNLKVLDQTKSTSIEPTIIKSETPDVQRTPGWQKKPRKTKNVVQGHGQSQSPVVTHQSERPGEICHGQTKMARLGSQSCCQLQRGSMPETHCCQRETLQSSLGSDHNNWLPVPPLFKTLCLWAGAAEPPPCSWVVECKRHHRIWWTTTKPYAHTHFWFCWFDLEYI